MSPSIEHDIIPNLSSTGFPTNFSVQELKELLYPVVFLCLTEQSHPITAFRKAFNNIELLDMLYRDEISEGNFVQSLLDNPDTCIVLSDEEDPHLIRKYVSLFLDVLVASAIANYLWDMSLREVINRFDKADVWSDIACNGRQMTAGDPWDVGNSLLRFAFGEDYPRPIWWNEIYECAVARTKQID